MRRSTRFRPSLGGLSLPVRIAPSAMAIAAVQLVSYDSLPDPEPSPGSDPGLNTPVIPVPLPPSGPIGPGTS